MYQIANEELILEVTEQGAEMKSLKDRASGREYLWCGDAKYWKRTAPVLFPLVGRYRDNESIYQGKVYHLSQHGFARDMEFSLISQTETELWFALEETEETLENYPFRLDTGWKDGGYRYCGKWRIPMTRKSGFPLADIRLSSARREKENAAAAVCVLTQQVRLSAGH